MRRDEQGNEVPHTLGEYLKLVSMLAPTSKAADLLREKIKEHGEDKECAASDYTMRQILIPLMSIDSDNGSDVVVVPVKESVDFVTGSDEDEDEFLSGEAAHQYYQMMYASLKDEFKASVQALDEKAEKVASDILDLCGPIILNHLAAQREPQCSHEQSIYNMLVNLAITKMVKGFQGDRQGEKDLQALSSLSPLKLKEEFDGILRRAKEKGDAFDYAVDAKPHHSVFVWLTMSTSDLMASLFRPIAPFGGAAYN